MMAILHSLGEQAIYNTLFEKIMLICDYKSDALYSGGRSEWQMN